MCRTVEKIFIRLTRKEANALFFKYYNRYYHNPNQEICLEIDENPHRESILSNRNQRRVYIIVDEEIWGYFVLKDEFLSGRKGKFCSKGFHNPSSLFPFSLSRELYTIRTFGRINSRTS